jgi:hypothetical protein
MKRLLLLLFFIPFISLAQVPQGVGYQGVATDANGIELINQAISIRASVLSGSATGTIEWEETHATSTDTFGLFTLTIGQGTNTTNGAQTSFADISWGTNTHFLKIEMDVTGGSTYSNMGTNQMMSVPYALYAESANINYDSISNFLSGDSTFITNVGGGMGGGGSGCDYAFPDGLDGSSIISTANNYIVPSGKTLYIRTLHTSSGEELIANGIKFREGANHTLHLPFIFESGVLLTGNAAFYGVLVENSTIQPISHLVDNGSGITSPYTIPSGKTLYITRVFGYFEINNIQLGADLNNNNQRTLGQIIKLGAGDIINATTDYTAFNGYLVDENYFANCGGGGASNTSLAQTLSLNNDTLSISGGNSVVLPVSGFSLVNSVNTYNTSFSSGGLGYGGSYSSTEAIDTLYISANTMVEISGFFTISRGQYINTTNGAVYCHDLTGSSVNFNTVSSIGVSISGFSYSLPGNCNNSHDKEGLFVMKKFFTSPITIIVYASCSATQNCAVGNPYCCGSFGVNTMISIDNY